MQENYLIRGLLGCWRAAMLYGVQDRGGRGAKTGIYPAAIQYSSNRYQKIDKWQYASDTRQQLVEGS
jgi:hypothetical protein